MDERSSLSKSLPAEARLWFTIPQEVWSREEKVTDLDLAAG